MNRFSRSAHQILNRIRVAFNGVYVALIFFSMFLLVALVVVTGTHVFMRHVLNSGLRWAEEVDLILVVWFTFIAMALGVKKDLHISVNLFSRTLNPRMETVLLKLKALAVLVVALVLVLHGWKLFQTGMRSTLPATGLPAGVQHLAMPVAGLLMLYDGLMDLCGLDKGDTPLLQRFFSRPEEEA